VTDPSPAAPTSPAHPPAHQYAPPDRHSHCPILPPAVLRAVASRGTPEQRERARRTILLDARLRAGRATATPPGGSPAGRSPAAAPRSPRRVVSDAGGTRTLPGRAVRAEGAGPTGDPAADEAYDGLGLTWTFWSEVLSRDSVDGRGLPLLGTVHYGEDYDNAFWDGRQMVFGDGDGELFGRFTASLDVIAHELAHGVTEVEAGLVYSGQAGALNESVSDVFGSLVKQRALGQTAEQADWLIGADLLRPGVAGVALRSMAAPGTAYDDPVLGKDPQPSTMSGFVVTKDDDGGVHINSGIPNHAFYLAAIAVGGPAWEAPGRAWYDALRSPDLRPDTDIAGFAVLTVAAAARLGIADQVRQAWRQVEVDLDAAGTEAAGTGTDGTGTDGTGTGTDAPPVVDTQPG
jgi:Zn-dependent metalloprotease